PTLLPVLSWLNFCGDRRGGRRGQAGMSVIGRSQLMFAVSVPFPCFISDLPFNGNFLGMGLRLAQQPDVRPSRSRLPSISNHSTFFRTSVSTLRIDRSLIRSLWLGIGSELARWPDPHRHLPTSAHA